MRSTIKIPFRKVAYTKVCESADAGEVFPYLPVGDGDGDTKMIKISSLHGSSFLVTRNDKGRCVFIKSYGLSDTKYPQLNAHGKEVDSLGHLLRERAINDFNLSNKLASWGIKTNKMEYVLELEENVMLTNGYRTKPILLQYTVDCPYRIYDFDLMEKEEFEDVVKKWEYLNDKGYDSLHLIAADILVHNVRIMQDNNILHSPEHIHNYTWALELLDLETADAQESHAEVGRGAIKDLLSCEVSSICEIIGHVAKCLEEQLDAEKVNAIFKDYGFDFAEYKL